MISSLKTAIGYNTNGSQKRFPFPNALIDGDHLEITLDDIPVESGYTVALETNRDLGAVVEFTTAPAAGQVLVISRATPITQTEEFVAGSNFDGDKFEGGLDKITMIIQERGFVCGDCIPLETTVLAATANGTDQIDLTWNAVEDPSRTGYELQRSLDGETGWITVASPAADDTSASNTGLDDDTTYYFRIRAVGGVLESEWSNIANATTDLAIPDAPSSLVATEDGTDTIDLTWTDNSDNEDNFIVQQSPNGTTGWVTISTPAAEAEADSATGLTEGTQYFFRVAAVNAAGTSAWSNTANDFTLPAAPSSLVATAISDTEIGLTWVDNSTAETSFSVERSLDGSTGWTEVLTPAADEESDTDTGLTAETEYFYKIKALRSGDSSAYSNVDSATTEAAFPLTDMIFWLEPENYNPSTGAWVDSSAAENDFALNSGTAPIAASNWSNGEDAVNFDVGANLKAVIDVGEAFRDTNVSGDPGGTLFIVGETDGSDHFISTVVSGGGAGADYNLIVTNTGDVNFVRNESSPTVTSVIGPSLGGAGTKVVIGVRIASDGTTIHAQVNSNVFDGTNDPQGAINQEHMRDFYLGGRGGGIATQPIIAEAIGYETALSDTDFDAVMQYLSDKYGIAIT